MNSHILSIDCEDKASEQFSPRFAMSDLLNSKKVVKYYTLM